MSNKTKVQYIRQPLFYKDFHCIGDECPVNCCFGWNVIGWSREEYEKLKKAEMSEELKAVFEVSFEPVSSEQYKKIFDYQIEYTNEKKCPMLAENGLCMVQRELGEEYLSFTCKVYPRTGHIYKDLIIRTCQCSCNYVLKIICNNERSMELENITNKKPEAIPVINDHTPDKLISHPILKYDTALFDFFYELLSDKTHSIETSIVLCAMAAQKIDEFVKKGQIDRIPEIIKALKPQLNNTVQIEKLENAKPNFSLKGNLSAILLRAVKNTSIYSSVFKNGIPDENKWAEGMEKFNETFKDRPFVLRNIALNLFISQKIPFKDVSFSLFENFSYFAAYIAIVKLLAASVSVQFDNVEEMFILSVAYIDRTFSHDTSTIKTIIEILHAGRITSPAYLMGILK